MFSSSSGPSRRHPIPLNALFLTHAAQMGGAEASLLDLLAGMDGSRVRPVVLSLAGGPLVDRLRAAGIPCEVLSGVSPGLLGFRRGDLSPLRPDRAARRLAETAALTKRIADAAKRFEARVVHTNSTKAHLIGGAAGRRAGIPTVWHARDYFRETPVRLLYQTAARAWPKAIIANSRFTATQFPKFKTTVVYNGFPPPPAVEKGRMEEFRRRWDLKEGDAAVCMMGRMDRWKGHLLFLNAAKLVLKKRPDVKFLIAGGTLYETPGYAREVAEAAAEPALAGSVRLTGHLDSPWTALAACGLYVHPSLDPEPFGRGIVEAMLSGTPALAARAGGPMEILEQGETGWFFPPGDANALADAILERLARPEETARAARTAQIRASERFSMRRYIDGVCDALERAAS